jgi:hypothetical protein
MFVSGIAHMVSFINNNGQEVLTEYSASGRFLPYHGRNQPWSGVLTGWVGVKLLELRKHHLESGESLAATLKTELTEWVATTTRLWSSCFDV